MRGRIQRNLLRTIVPGLLLLLTGLTMTGAAECDLEAWAFYGAVRTAGGQPVGDAEVFLLLDKISQSAYAKEGVRGRRFRTNAYGKYQAGLVCSDSRDAPNPCGKRRRHLTVAVSSRNHSMKLQVFKLRDLNVAEVDGVCFVQMPEIKLSRGF